MDRQISPALPQLTWRADNETFNNALVAALRTDDAVSVIVLLDEMSRDAVLLLESDGENAGIELRTLLDRLACVAAATIRFIKPALLSACVRTAYSVYMSGFDERGGQKNPQSSRHGMSSPLLWLELTKRIIAVGGMAVRRNDWLAVRELARQLVADRHSVAYGLKQYWLRHAVKEASNARIFDTSNVLNEQSRSLITDALSIAGQEASLSPDIPGDDYRLLQSLLEFDLLATLVVSADAGEFNTSYVYPTFIYWEIYQVEPLLTRLLTDQEMRDVLFAGKIEDEFLASVLHEIAEMADRKSSAWSYWRARAITNFLNKYTTSNSTR